MSIRTAVPVTVLFCAIATPAAAQVERYELSYRLKRFETDWETADEAGRKRALRVLKPLSRQYLTFQHAEAARTLDEARFALRAEKPTEAERWFASLAMVPEKRLVDTKTTEIKVEVRAFYKTSDGPPPDTSLEARFSFGDNVTVTAPGLPVTLRVPLPTRLYPCEHTLRLKLIRDGVRVDARTLPVFAQDDLAGEYTAWLKRIASPQPSEEPLSSSSAGIELATIRAKSETLLKLASSDTPETDIPVLDWGAEFMTCMRIGPIGGRYFMSDGWFLTPQPADFTAVVPTTGGRQTWCRFKAPRPKRGKPVPAVVALHGMGGSENLYFEGYGAGCVVKACEKRGWMLVCPRSEGGFLGGPPPVTEIVAKLAERYPIDPSRIFLMGHSMGASQAVDLVQRHPDSFAAVAVLGGGGRVRKPAAFADLLTFIGVGSEDFARGGAVQLHKALTAAGAKAATLKEYPDVEHTVIVRAAVDDVFRMFDGVNEQK